MQELYNLNFSTEMTIELDVTNQSREGLVTSSSMVISTKNDWTRNLWLDCRLDALTFRDLVPILRSQRMPNLPT